MLQQISKRLFSLAQKINSGITLTTNVFADIIHEFDSCHHDMEAYYQRMKREEKAMAFIKGKKYISWQPIEDHVRKTHGFEMSSTLRRIKRNRKAALLQWVNADEALHAYVDLHISKDHIRMKLKNDNRRRQR